MQVIGCWYASPPPAGQLVVGHRWETKAQRAPLPPKPPPSCVLQDVLEALCSSMLVSKTLEVQSNLVIRCNQVPQLTSYFVQDGEKFGTLAQWSHFVESTRSPNIVVYFVAKRQFYVVCANATLTQKVETRSAICWLRERAGLGFCVDEENGGVFHIQVFRCLIGSEDPSCAGLQKLMSTLDEN